MLSCPGCGNKTLQTDFNCPACDNALASSPALEYTKVSYLLAEVEKPLWRTAIQPTSRERVLYSYRLNRQIAGLQIGLIKPCNAETRHSNYLAVLYLEQDLTTKLPKALSDFECQEFLEYLAGQKTVFEVEYATLNEVAPTLPGKFEPELKKAVLVAALKQVHAFSHHNLLGSTAYHELIARYELRLKRLNEREQPQPAKSLPSLVPDWQTVEVAPAPRRERAPVKWEDVWKALLSETTLRALLYLGALMVIVAAGLFVTLNWDKFSAWLQATILLAVDLAFFGAGAFIGLKLKLRRAGLTFVAIGAAIFPLAVYGYTRPEILNLDVRASWSWISLLVLPCYLLIAYFVRERLFSYMVCLAALNFVWAGLNQTGLHPEWLAVAAIPVAAAMLWFDVRLKTNHRTAEMAVAPFQVGHATVVTSALALFSYYLQQALTGTRPAELDWAFGLQWWLIAAFYAWCANSQTVARLLYKYAALVSLIIAYYLTLQKLPLATEWHGFALALLGVVYLTVQSLPDLVEALNNTDVTAEKWPLDNVFNRQKPLNNLGWLLVTATPFMATTRPSLAAGFALLAALLVLATLLYNWTWLAYLAVAASLVAIYLALPAMPLAFAGAAVIYCALGWYLKPVRATRRAKVGPYTYPALIGWLTTGALALQTSWQNWFEAGLISLILTITAVLVTYRLKKPEVNWLVAGLGLYLVWNGAIYWHLADNQVALLLALLAGGFFLTRVLLGQRYGSPFAVCGHILAWLSVSCSLIYGFAAPYRAAIELQISAVTLVAICYTLLAIFFKQPRYFYPFGLAVTLGLTLVAHATYQAFGWPSLHTLGWSYLLASAVSSAVFGKRPYVVPPARPLRLRGLNQLPLFSEHALSQLAHGWLILSLLVAGNLALQSQLMLGGVLLYVGRSWAERRSAMLLWAAILGVASTASFIRLYDGTVDIVGLGLIALAVIYLAFGQFYGNHKPVKQFDYQHAAQIFSYGGQLLVVLGVALALPSKPSALVALILATLIALWLARRVRVEWGYVAIASGLSGYALAFDLLKINWNWFGLALLIPALVCGLSGRLIVRRPQTNLQFVMLGQMLLAVTSAMVAGGLVFSWADRPVLVVHSAIITGLSLVLWREQRQAWWWYAILAAGELTYLATLWLVLPKLTQAEQGLAVLVPGLSLLAVAVYFGLKTGDNLKRLAMLSCQSNGLPEFSRAVSLPFYLAAGLNLSFSILLVATNPVAGMVVAGSVAAGLLAVACLEKNERISWLALALAVLTGWFAYQWSALSPNVALILVAAVAPVLPILAYALDRGLTQVLARPLRYSAYILSFGNAVSWLVLGSAIYARNSSLWLDTASWLIGLGGLLCLITALIERRREEWQPQLLRYLTYGGVALVELAFVLRLVLVNAGELQLYALPVGLSCLVVGWYERRYENERIARLMEAIGLIITLGTSLVQSTGGLTGEANKLGYGCLLLIESILALGFGAAHRYRYYFFGGIVALVADVVIMGADPVRATDKWVILGVSGMFLISVAIFLERKRETVVRLSKEWFFRLRQWH